MEARCSSGFSGETVVSRALGCALGARGEHLDGGHSAALISAYTSSQNPRVADAIALRERQSSRPPETRGTQIDRCIRRDEPASTPHAAQALVHRNERIVRVLSNALDASKRRLVPGIRAHGRVIPRWPTRAKERQEFVVMARCCRPIHKTARAGSTASQLPHSRLIDRRTTRPRRPPLASPA